MEEAAAADALRLLAGGSYGGPPASSAPLPERLDGQWAAVYSTADGYADKWAPPTLAFDAARETLTRTFDAGLFGRVRWTGAVSGREPEAAAATRTAVAPPLAAAFCEDRLDVALLHLADDVCALRQGPDLVLLKRIARATPTAPRPARSRRSSAYDGAY